MFSSLLETLAATVEAAVANRKLPVRWPLWILAAVLLALLLVLAFA